MHMHFIKKKCTPYHTYQFAGSSQEKEDKTQFCGQAKACKPLRGLQAGQWLQPHCVVLGFCSSTTHTLHNLPAIHPAAAPRPRLPATLPAAALTKTKKIHKIPATRMCKKCEKEIKMDKYRKKNRKIKENKGYVCVVLVEFWQSSDVLRLFVWSKECGVMQRCPPQPCSFGKMVARRHREMRRASGPTQKRKITHFFTLSLEI